MQNLSPKFLERITKIFTSLGCTFLPSKPHHKVNYYHDICCVNSKIIQRWELVERWDQTKELKNQDYQTGPGISTMSFMWRMTQPLWEKIQAVIMDSYLCLLRGFISMLKRGVYGSVMVKNYIFWTIGMYGDGINAHFDPKQLNITDSQEIGRAQSLMGLL